MLEAGEADVGDELILLERNSIPAICTFRDFAYEGGLMAYFAEE